MSDPAKAERPPFLERHPRLAILWIALKLGIAVLALLVLTRGPTTLVYGQF